MFQIGTRSPCYYGNKHTLSPESHSIHKAYRLCLCNMCTKERVAEFADLFFDSTKSHEDVSAWLEAKCGSSRSVKACFAHLGYDVESYGTFSRAEMIADMPASRGEALHQMSCLVEDFGDPHLPSDVFADVLSQCAEVTLPYLAISVGLPKEATDEEFIHAREDRFRDLRQDEDGEREPSASRARISVMRDSRRRGPSRRNASEANEANARVAAELVEARSIIARLRTERDHARAEARDRRSVDRRPFVRGTVSASTSTQQAVAEEDIRALRREVEDLRRDTENASGAAAAAGDQGVAQILQQQTSLLQALAERGQPKAAVVPDHPAAYSVASWEPFLANGDDVGLINFLSAEIGITNSPILPSRMSEATRASWESLVFHIRRICLASLRNQDESWIADVDVLEDGLLRLLVYRAGELGADVSRSRHTVTSIARAARCEAVWNELVQRASTAKARSKPEAGPGRFRGTCHWCGAKGHKESDCKKKKSGAPRVPSGNGSGDA